MLKRILASCPIFMSTPKPNKVGFIGLGNMGYPMARNLVNAGFEVKGYDLLPSVRSQLNEIGVKDVASLDEACKDVDFIVTILPKTEHVKEVMFADDGILNSAAKGTLICDASTISPYASQEIANAASEKGLAFCDTPVTGGIMGAQAGTLNFLVGALEKEHFERTKVVLAGMGKRFFYCGEPGKGQIAKIVNNQIIGTQMLAVSEGMNLGNVLGIDQTKLQQILSVSTSSCWCTNATNPVPGVVEGSPATNDYKGGYQLALTRKDMKMACDLGDEAKVNVDTAKHSLSYFEELEKLGYGGKDWGYVYQYIAANKKL